MRKRRITDVILMICLQRQAEELAEMAEEQAKGMKVYGYFLAKGSDARCFVERCRSGRKLRVVNPCFFGKTLLRKEECD